LKLGNFVLKIPKVFIIIIFGRNWRWQYLHRTNHRPYPPPFIHRALSAGAKRTEILQTFSYQKNFTHVFLSFCRLEDVCEDTNIGGFVGHGQLPVY
jgi:hypothetical protein